MNILVELVPQNKRAQSLADNAELVRLLSENAINVIKRVLPTASVECAGSVLECNAYLSGKPAVIVVNPLNGPVSVNRFSDLLAENPSRERLVSAMQVSPNSNPMWLRVFPEYQDDGYDFSPLTKFEPATAYISAKEASNGKKPVVGSQFLPELYIADNAIVFHPAGDDNECGVRHVPYSVYDDDSASVFYKLPTFQMAETAAVEWPENIDFSLLFSGEDEPAITEESPSYVLSA